MARDMLAKGVDEPAASMAKRLAGETKTLGESYETARTGLADAEILYARLPREGFHSYDADAAIRDTRTAMREGNYPRALEHLERAQMAFARRTNAREALAQAPGGARGGGADGGGGRGGGAGGAPKGDEDAPGRRGLVPPGHPGGPRPRGTGVPQRELLRVERGPADRDGPPGPDGAGAEPEGMSGGLKVPPIVLRTAWASSTSPVGRRPDGSPVSSPRSSAARRSAS